MVRIAWIGYMECIGTSLGQNARATCEMEVELQGVHCFASFWCFDVQECLRDAGSYFWLKAMCKTCFKCLQELVISDTQVVSLLQVYLYFKQK